MWKHRCECFFWSFICNLFRPDGQTWSSYHSRKWIIQFCGFLRYLSHFVVVDWNTSRISQDCQNAILAAILIYSIPRRSHLSVRWISGRIWMFRGGLYQRMAAGAMTVSQKWYLPRERTSEQTTWCCLAKDNNISTGSISDYASEQKSNFEWYTSTVTNIMQAAGLRLRPARGGPMTDRHRHHWLAWCRGHLNWTQALYSIVIFTNRAQFYLDFHGGCN